MPSDSWLILDRDGVINYDEGYFYDVRKLKLYLDSIVLMKYFSARGFKVLIVTNQSGIAKGKYTHNDLNCLMSSLLMYLESFGIAPVLFRYCPHSALDGCDCRKPKIGMVEDLLDTGRINKQTSIMIGDKLSDVYFGSNMGLKKLYLLNRNAQLNLETIFGGFPGSPVWNTVPSLSLKYFSDC